MTPADLQKKLADIMEVARENHFYIKKEEVEKAFQEFDLTDEQMKFVYEFLLAKRIVVGGFAQEEKTEAEIKPEWTKEEERFLVDYRENLMSMKLMERGSNRFHQAFTAAAGGDTEARNKLSEAFLQDVVDEAVRSYTGAVLLPDMIQEGNLRMVLALDSYDYSSKDAEELLYDQIRAEVRTGIRSLLEEQKDVHVRDERLVGKVEDFRDHLDILREDVGRKVYLDEVAEFMNITEDEAEDILRLAGENMDGDQGESDQ